MPISDPAVGGRASAVDKPDVLFTRTTTTWPEVFAYWSRAKVGPCVA